MSWAEKFCVICDETFIAVNRDAIYCDFCRTLSNKHKFKFSRLEYTKAYKEQEGKCSICGTRKERLCIDHDHKLNVYRGLLCNTCNMGLGAFKDNAQYLIQAIKYLVKFWEDAKAF